MHPAARHRNWTPEAKQSGRLGRVQGTSSHRCCSRSVCTPSLVPFTPCCSTSSLLSAIQDGRQIKDRVPLLPKLPQKPQVLTSAYKSLARTMSHGLPALNSEQDRQQPEGLLRRWKRTHTAASSPGWVRGPDQRTYTNLDGRAHHCDRTCCTSMGRACDGPLYSGISTDT